MNVLVIGQGGREHALLKALKKSPLIKELFILPGNDGMTEATRVSLLPSQTTEITKFCLNKSIDYVFIGPEVPLAEGLSNSLRENNILVVGPSQEAAQLESSKIYAKDFMLKANVPTARAFVVRSTSECLKAATNFAAPFVLKADGLAAGKGVYICKNTTELETACNELFEQKILGKAGETALLEEFTPGWELSYLIFTNGKDFKALPIAQDHKRLNDNHQGPNTGGMGTIAPLKISLELEQKIIQQVVKPSLKEMQNRDYLYRGVLFIGLMVHEDSISVLEYNVRLGDPETQVVLPLVKSDLNIFLHHLAKGELHELDLFADRYACCVVLAAEGYPQSPISGTLIEGNLTEESSSQYFIHAGTKKDSNHWLVNGGRVMGAIGIGKSSNEAITNAYTQAKKTHFKGMQFRTDIGKYLPTN